MEQPKIEKISSPDDCRKEAEELYDKFKEQIEDFKKQGHSRRVTEKIP